MTSITQQYLNAMGIELWLDKNTTPALPATTADHALQKGANMPTATRLHSTNASQPVLDRFGEEPRPQIRLDELDQQDLPTKIAAVDSLDWEALAGRIADCRICPLCKSRKQTVFGSGQQQVELLIVGDAPDAEEEQRREPIAGSAGMLLTAMLGAIGLDRSQVFVTNSLKCRPPEDREPHLDEIQKCRPYLMRQVELVAPKLILTVGRFAAQHLLDSSESLANLRNHQFRFGPNQIPLIVSYHPAYLLRKPELKAKVWQDLQKVAALLKFK